MYVDYKKLNSIPNAQNRQPNWSFRFLTTLDLTHLAYLTAYSEYLSWMHKKVNWPMKMADGRYKEASQIDYKISWESLVFVECQNHPIQNAIW